MRLLKIKIMIYIVAVGKRDEMDVYKKAGQSCKLDIIFSKPLQQTL